MTLEPMTAVEGGGEPARRPIPLTIILMGVVVLAAGLYIGTQVIGVLFSLIAPPAPPTPSGLTQVEHTSTSYGNDEWLYTSAQHPCEVAQFFIENGGQCEFAPQWCTEGGGTSPDSFARIVPGDHVARCTGTSSFSIFAQRWQVLIATSGYSGAEGATFRLVRDVLWNGDAGPPISLPVETPVASP
jgi:hypothetical protein